MSHGLAQARTRVTNDGAAEAPALSISMSKLRSRGTPAKRARRSTPRSGASGADASAEAGRPASLLPPSESVRSVQAVIERTKVVSVTADLMYRYLRFASSDE